MMLLRSEMREEVRERMRNHTEKGQEPDGTTGKLDFPRGRRREVATSRDYEERVTYRTITRTEFQKRRASFEGHEEAIGGEAAAVGSRGRVMALRKKTRSLDELVPKDDSYRIQFREKEMTEKLEDIHRMIVDMQEMTKQLKDRNYSQGEKKVQVTSIGAVFPREESPPMEQNESAKKPPLQWGPALTVKPVRYRSTIVIAVGSKWRRFKEEIELNVDFSLTNRTRSSRGFKT